MGTSIGPERVDLLVGRNGMIRPAIGKRPVGGGRPASRLPAQSTPHRQAGDPRLHPTHITIPTTCWPRACWKEEPLETWRPPGSAAASYPEAVSRKRSRVRTLLGALECLKIGHDHRAGHGDPVPRSIPITCRRVVEA